MEWSNKNLAKESCDDGNPKKGVSNTPKRPVSLGVVAIHYLRRFILGVNIVIFEALRTSHQEKKGASDKKRLFFKESLFWGCIGLKYMYTIILICNILDYPNDGDLVFFLILSSQDFRWESAFLLLRRGNQPICKARFQPAPLKVTWPIHPLLGRPWKLVNT